MDNNFDNITDGSQFQQETSDAIIKVIGVGGGGGNAVNYMFRENIPNINFVVCNTDKQALDASPVPTKLVLGYEVTGGLGAGNIPEKGRECAEASADEIRKLFNDKTEMVFITAGMGGGTGTGAAPVVARIAKEAGMLTIGIVTVPFYFEGQKKILKALDGATELRQHVDALLVINNENLIDLYPDWTLFNAFEKADDTLANAARSISEIISETCYINVDFQDVKTILKDSGTAIISTDYGEGEHRISNAINNALRSPLLKTHDIKTSKRLLLKFSCNRNSERPIKAEEMNEISQFTEQLPPTIDVKWGIADNPELGDKVKVTVLASGFDVTLRDSKKGAAVIKMEPDSNGESQKQTAATTIPLDRQEEEERIIDIYGKEKLIEKWRTAAKIKYAVLRPSQFDDEEIIDRLEKTPTFGRDTHFNESLHPKKRSTTAAGQTSAQQGNTSAPESPAKEDNGPKIIF